MCVNVLQLIQTVTAVDPDEPLGGQHFYYSLAPEAANNPNFTLRDNQGTCMVHTGCSAVKMTSVCSLSWIEDTHTGSRMV